MDRQSLFLFLSDRKTYQLPEQHRRVIFILVIISLLSVTPIGYHLVVLNVPVQVIQNAVNTSAIEAFNWNLTQTELSIIWSTIVSVQSIGALFGCALTPLLVTNFGTKLTVLIINNSILAVASLTFAVANSTYSAFLLLLGRILSGIYIGISCVSVPFLVQELAPKNIRGSLSCIIHIAVCIGATLAALLSLDFMLGNELLWGLLLALPAVLGFVQIFGSKSIPDTPNHLLLSGQEKSAVRSIRFYYGIDTLDDDKAIAQYRELVTQFPDQISPWRALSDPSTRYAILIGMVVSASQIFCGSVATISYSTSMFTSVAFIGSLVPFLPAFGSLFSALLSLPALVLVESFGRRKLFLWTLAICALSDCLLTVFSLLSHDGFLWSVMFAFTFVLFGFGYNIGVGPAAYFIPGELVPPEAASVALSAAVAVNWLSALTTTFLYYPLNVAVGGWSYLLFAVPSTIFLIFLYATLPETKNLHQTDCVQVVRQRTLIEDYGTFLVS